VVAGVRYQNGVVVLPHMEAQTIEGFRSAIHTKGSSTMPISQNDVNVLAVETNDQDFTAGTNIVYKVRAEVGSALFGTGGKYRIRITVTDTTNPALLNSQDVQGNYGDANWPAAGLNTFSFTVPAAATNGREGDLVEPQARLVANAAAPFDGSYVIGERVLLTP
jgi:hypothetical protein